MLFAGDLTDEWLSVLHTVHISVMYFLFFASKFKYRKSVIYPLSYIYIFPLKLLIFTLCVEWPTHSSETDLNFTYLLRNNTKTHSKPPRNIIYFGK